MCSSVKKDNDSARSPCQGLESWDCFPYTSSIYENNPTLGSAILLSKGT